MTPFGIEPIGIVTALMIVAWVGWTYTLYKYSQALQAMHRGQFWWSWWVETAVRKGIVIEDEDIHSADELTPDDSPTIPDQIGAVTEEPHRHLDIDGGDG